MYLVIYDDLGESIVEMPKSTKNSKNQSVLFPYYVNKWVYDVSENLNHTKQAAKEKRIVYDKSESLNHARQVAMRMSSNVVSIFNRQVQH